MYYYAKAMYEGWCQGRSATDIELNYRDFVVRAAKAFAMYETEMLEYLQDTDWFKMPVYDSRNQPD